MKVSTILLVGLGAFLGSCDRPYNNKSSSSPSGKAAALSADFDPNEIANDAEVQKYQEKGSWLGCLLNASDEAGGEIWPDPYSRPPKSAHSPWLGTLGTLAEISIWGWHEGSYDAEINCDFSQDGNENYNHIGDALKSLALNVLPQQAGGDDFCFSIQHFDEDAVDEDDEAIDYFDPKYTVNGRKYSATGAFFRFAINYVGGDIFAQNLESPKSAAAENWDFNPDYDMLPKLRLASDVMFPYWTHNNANPKKLRYYFVNTVANEVTQRVIAKIVQKKGLPDLPEWPGITLGMWEREAEYLLGSPIGATIAFMLIQHKVELGRKHVTDITAFFAPGNQVQLIFKITDVPLSEEDSSGSSVNLQLREADENLHILVSTSEINNGVEKAVKAHIFTVARGKAKL